MRNARSVGHALANARTGFSKWKEAGPLWFTPKAVCTAATAAAICALWVQSNMWVRHQTAAAIVLAVAAVKLEECI